MILTNPFTRSRAKGGRYSMVKLVTFLTYHIGNRLLNCAFELLDKGLPI